jgi:hypothetical protein
MPVAIPLRIVVGREIGVGDASHILFLGKAGPPGEFWIAREVDFRVQNSRCRQEPLAINRLFSRLDASRMPQIGSNFAILNAPKCA